VGNIPIDRLRDRIQERSVTIRTILGRAPIKSNAFRMAFHGGEKPPFSGVVNRGQNESKTAPHLKGKVTALEGKSTALEGKSDRT
jgi:hypothetical protein